MLRRIFKLTPRYWFVETVLGIAWALLSAILFTVVMTLLSPPPDPAWRELPAFTLLMVFLLTFWPMFTSQAATGTFLMAGLVPLATIAAIRLLPGPWLRFAVMALVLIWWTMGLPWISRLS